MTMTDDLDIEMEEDIVNPAVAAEAAAFLTSGLENAKPVEDDKEEPVGLLEDEAKKRKDRLRALKQKLMGGGGGPDAKEVKKIDMALPKPMFRSYNPSDNKLQDAAVPKAKVIDIEEQIADTLEHSVVKPVVEDVDLTSLAPRKPDWDLKRDVAPKLAKLERRTQRAIAELILDRLKNNQQNLAAAVEFSENPHGRNIDDDDE